MYPSLGHNAVLGFLTLHMTFVSLFALQCVKNFMLCSPIIDNLDSDCAFNDVWDFAVRLVRTVRRND